MSYINTIITFITFNRETSKSKDIVIALSLTDVNNLHSVQTVAFLVGVDTNLFPYRNM